MKSAQSFEPVLLLCCSCVLKMCCMSMNYIIQVLRPASALLLQNADISLKSVCQCFSVKSSYVICKHFIFVYFHLFFWGSVTSCLLCSCLNRDVVAGSVWVSVRPLPACCARVTLFLLLSLSFLLIVDEFIEMNATVWVWAGIMVPWKPFNGVFWPSRGWDGWVHHGTHAGLCQTGWSTIAGSNLSGL